MDQVIVMTILTAIMMEIIDAIAEPKRLPVNNL